jgi:hypothetical protein
MITGKKLTRQGLKDHDLRWQLQTGRFYGDLRQD